MDVKKIRLILDLVLEYWPKTIGAAVGGVSLFLVLFNVITYQQFLINVGAAVSIGYIPKLTNNKKNDVSG